MLRTQRRLVRRGDENDGRSLESKEEAHRVELLLKFLVGVVDAELFEAVHLKRLEAADKQKEDLKVLKLFVSRKSHISSNKVH